MKTIRRMFAASLVAMVLAGCQQAKEIESVESRMVSLNIGANISFNTEISEWGSGTDSDLTTNGETVKSRTETSPASRMAFVLLDENGQKVVAQEKGSDDKDFLTLRAQVPVGTYNLIAFGHNGSGNATIGTDATISFPGEKLTDSFLYFDELELDEKVAKEKTVTLKRCVSRLSVYHTDKIPAEAVSVEIAVAGAGKVLNAKTGFADEGEDQTITIQIPESVVGSAGNTFSCYLFLTEKESFVDLEVTVKDADGKTITYHELEDVPVKVNVKTTCRGVLFHAVQSLTASFDAEWGDDEEVDF